MLKKFWEVNFFTSNVLVPLAVLAIYCSSFELLSPFFIPEGVNYVFVSRLWQIVLLLLAGLYVAFFVLFKLSRKNELEFKNTAGKFFVSDLFLLLFPLIPVVQYILSNQHILSPIDSLSLVVFFVFFSGLYIFAIPALLGIFSSTRTLMIMGLAFVSTIASMALLSHNFAWFGSGSLKIQLLFLGGVFLVTLLLNNFNKKILHILIAVLFVSNITVQLLSKGSGAAGSPLSFKENKLYSSVDGRKPATTPNVYLLIYDAYVSNETMLAHGIDNSSQEDYLKGQGFTLYPHTYSIGAETVETMSRVLNASPEYYGDWRRAISGDGVVQNLFKSLGYRTYGIFPSDYEFRGIGSSYDVSFPPFRSQNLLLLRGILMGEFRYDLGFNDVSHEEYVETKRNILEGVSGNPIFIYSHSNLPSHSQNSGACLPNETDLYQDRLTAANSEMRKDIEIINQNDPKGIIIIAGDHGPYLTKNCTDTTGFYDISGISRLDIQDRVGTFLAVRWPTADFTKYDDITVLEDVFPAVFAYLYKDDSILGSKVAPITLLPGVMSGAEVNNGIIQGGINNGEPLFISGK